MLRRLTRTAIAERNNRPSIWDYSSKRDSLSQLLIARNQGNNKASVIADYVLKQLAASKNRNAGIAATLLDKSHKFSTIFYSESQLNGLAMMAAELGCSIPECPYIRLEDNHEAPQEESVCNNDEFDVIEKPEPEEEAVKWIPNPEGVRLFDIVEFVDTETGELRIMQIVQEGQCGCSQDYASINSPIARALIGHVAGDVVSAKTPVGPHTLMINCVAR